MPIGKNIKEFLGDGILLGTRPIPTFFLKPEYRIIEGRLGAQYVSFGPLTLPEEFNSEEGIWTLIEENRAFSVDEAAVPWALAKRMKEIYYEAPFDPEDDSDWDHFIYEDHIITPQQMREISSSLKDLICRLSSDSTDCELLGSIVPSYYTLEDRSDTALIAGFAKGKDEIMGFMRDFAGWIDSMLKENQDTVYFGISGP